MAQEHTTGLQLRSTVKQDGTLELTLVRIPTPEPKPDEVVVKVQATPLNPSDIALLLGGVDLKSLKSGSTSDGPTVTGTVPPEALRFAKPRLDQSLPVGNEGAGVVIAAGSDAAAQQLIGKTVSVIGGAMYTEYRTVKLSQILELPSGTTAEHGASWYVNPFTALGMVETMRNEGHTAIVHTAAASNLGQMLQKICTKDGIQLVNVVRKPEQVEILKSIGAKHVVDTSQPKFMEQLIELAAETGATIAFDAIGGGTLGSQILTAMEAAAARKMEGFSRYGSTTFKQLYIYGGLDRSPTTLSRSFGFSWAVGGWLLTPFMMKSSPEAQQRLRTRVANELKTTFASSYGKRVDLRELLQPEVIASVGKQATGEKYLLTPSR